MARTVSIGNNNSGAVCRVALALSWEQRATGVCADARGMSCRVPSRCVCGLQQLKV